MNSNYVLSVTVNADASQYVATLANAGQVTATFSGQVQQASQAVAAATRSEDAAHRANAAAVAQETAARERFLASLRDQVEIQGKTTAEVMRYRAAQLGVSESAEQYIRAIEAGARANTGGAMSAKEHAMAMRMLPMQMTDVVTSLASGMPVWMVAIQQGGQLKDSFHGVGAAAKAMVGYVARVVSPLVLVAAGVAALGFAAYSGAQEQGTLSRSLIMSGNAAGTTAGDMAVLAANMRGVAGTQGAAVEALAAMAQSGDVGADRLQKFASAAIAMEKAAGIAVGDTVKSFRELARAPVEASIKLNESMHYLTASVYKQIKALQELGQTAEAADLAQNTFADAYAERSREMLASLGLLERGWNSVASAIGKAWDGVKGIGRDAGPQAQADALRLTIKSYEANQKAGGFLYAPEIADKQIAKMREQLAYLDHIIASERDRAKYKADEAAKVQTIIDFDKEHEKVLDSKVKAQRDLNAAVEKYRPMVESGEISAQRYAELINGINKKTIDTPKHQPIDEYTRLSEEMVKAEALARAELQSNGKLSDADKYRVETLQKLIDQYQEGKISIGQYIDLEAKMTNVEAIKRKVDAIKEEEKATKDRVANSVLSINAELDAYYRQRDAITEVNKALNDLAHANADQADALQYEATLHGRSADERARAIEQYRLLAQYKAEAARIESTVGDPAVRAAQLAALDVQRQQALSNAAARDALNTWNQTFDRINTGLTDAIMSAGKDGGAGLRDFLEAELLSRPFRMVVQAIVQPIAGAMTGALVGDAGSAAGGGIINSALGSMIGQGATMASLGTAFGEGFMATLGGSSIGGGAAAGILSTGGAAGAGTAGMLGAAAPWALGALALARMLSGPGFTSATDSGRARIDYSSAGVGSAASATTGTQAQIDAQVIATNGLAKSYFDAAKNLGIQALAASFEVGTNTGREGSAPNTVLGVNVGGRSYSSGEISSSDAAGLSLAASRALMTALQASELPKYLSGVFDGITASTATQDQITAALQSAQALKGFHDQLQAMPWTQLKDLSYQAAQGLAEAAGGLDKLTAGLGGFYDRFYSDSEKQALLLQNTRSALAALGETMPALDAHARDWYRAEVERAMALDQSVPANARLTAGLLALSGAMDTLAPALQDTAKAAAEAEKVTRDKAMADLERAVSTEQQRLALNRDIAQEQATAVRSVFDTLKSNIQSLHASVASTRDMAAVRGQAYIAQALATAQSTGYLPDNTQLADAITAARGGVDAAIYASQADADYARQVLAGQLGQLQTVAGTQLTTSERTLRAAQDQIDGLDAILENAKRQLDVAQGINDGILTVADAINSLHQALKPDASSSEPPTGVGSGSGGGMVVAGPGAEPTLGVGAGGDVAKYSRRVDLGGYGAVQIPVTDASEIARFDSIAAYIRQVGVATPEDVRKIADTAAQYGVTQSDIATAMGYRKDDIAAVFARAGIPAFAKGGFHGGGWAMVGEQGPELAYMPPARIYTAADTRSMIGSESGGSQKLETLIETLIVEIKDLKSITGAGSSAGQRLLALLDDVTNGGNAIRSRAVGV